MYRLERIAQAVFVAAPGLLAGVFAGWRVNQEPALSTCWEDHPIIPCVVRPGRFSPPSEDGPGAGDTETPLGVGPDQHWQRVLVITDDDTTHVVVSPEGDTLPDLRPQRDLSSPRDTVHR